MHTAEDHDLSTLVAARDGVHRAGQELVDRFGASMVRTAWSVLGTYGGTEADDVVQEAFIAALTTGALPTGDVGAWLRSIVARKALDWLRDRGRKRENPLPEPDSGSEPVADSRDQEAAVAAITVRKGLARLAAVDRAVLVLADIEGKSMAEVARDLGITRTAAKLRASRARRKLAGILGDNLGQSVRSANGREEGQ